MYKLATKFYLFTQNFSNKKGQESWLLLSVDIIKIWERATKPGLHLGLESNLTYMVHR